MNTKLEHRFHLEYLFREANKIRGCSCIESENKILQIKDIENQINSTLTKFYSNFRFIVEFEKFLFQDKEVCASYSLIIIDQQIETLTGLDKHLLYVKIFDNAKLSCMIGHSVDNIWIFDSQTLNYTNVKDRCDQYSFLNSKPKFAV